MGADITVLREREVDYDSDEPRKIAEVLVRKVPDDQQVRTPVYKLKHIRSLYIVHVATCTAALLWHCGYKQKLCCKPSFFFLFFFYFFFLISLIQ